MHVYHDTESTDPSGFVILADYIPSIILDFNDFFHRSPRNNL